MPHPYSIIREKNFNKGYNDRVPAEHLPAGYLADALNCYVRADDITKRTGFSRVGNDLSLSTLCQGLKGVRFANGTKELIAVFNGNIYKWTGSGNWSASLGSGLHATDPVDIVVANNSAYFFDGTNTVLKYNGTTVSTVAAIPIGKFAKWFHNSLYVAGISGFPNNLRISNLGDPEDFSAGTTATISVNPNDGDLITGLGILKDELLVFKMNRVWSITGFGTSTLTVSNLNERLSGFGTVAYRSIVNTGNDLLYLSFFGDVPHIRSLQRTRFGVLVDGGIISFPIEGSLKTANKAQLSKCAATFDGINARYAIADTSSTTPNRVYVYDTVNQGWVRHTGMNISVWEIFDIGTTIQIYFGDTTSNSRVFVLDTSTSDNGTAINFQVITRRYGGDMPERKKKYKYLYVDAKDTGNYDLTVDKSKDGFSYDNLGTMNLTGAGAIFDNIILDTSKLGATDVKPKRFSIAKTNSRYIQFKMYDTSATSSITVRSWEVIGFPRSIREV